MPWCPENAMGGLYSVFKRGGHRFASRKRIKTTIPRPEVRAATHLLQVKSPDRRPVNAAKTEKRLRRIDASASGTEGPAAYCAASLPDFWAASSRSITPRQPVLRSARCLIMQDVIFGILGISELQKRNASPVHCCCASALKAKLAVDETAQNEAVKASAKLTLRTVLA